MPTYNPFFTELGACPSDKAYIDEKEIRRGPLPRKKLYLSNLVEGRRYLLNCCRPKRTVSILAGYHHIESTFVYKGTMLDTSATGPVTLVIMDLGNDHTMPAEAHILGLAPFDGWGEDISFYDELRDPSSKSHVGKWNHFSYVIPVPKR